MRDRFLVKPGSRFRLADRNPNDTAGVKSKKDAEARVGKNLKRLFDLQYVMYAENRRALLVVLQGMDAAGKDGTIRHVMTGLNPQGCRVSAFKAPTPEELAHDFLWRIHRVVPPHGTIGIFNRSHYEDVLIVRVHDIVPERVWSRRYEQINRFERTLADNGVVIVKFFLHISRKEQEQRLRDRLDDPSRHWKLSPGDFEERKYWANYQSAYQEALARCSTPWAPWYVIPANKKWFRDLSISDILADTLKSLRMKLPEPKYNIATLKRLLTQSAR